MLSYSKNFKFACSLVGFHVRIALNLLKYALFLVIPHAYSAILKYAMTDITDDELNATVREVLSQFPNSGIRTIKGHLLSQNIKVTWERIRNAHERRYLGRDIFCGLLSIKKLQTLQNKETTAKVIGNCLIKNTMESPEIDCALCNCAGKMNSFSCSDGSPYFISIL